MSWERKHPLALRGRSLPDRGADHWQTVSLIVHRTSEGHSLVSMVVTDNRGNSCKDTRLGECWIPSYDDMGRQHAPYRLLQLALMKLLAQPGARLLPDGYDTTGVAPGAPGGATGAIGSQPTCEGS